MYLPVMEPLEKDHFLSINKTQAYIDTNSPYLDEPMSNLPTVKENTILNKRLTKGKYKDRR